MQGNPFKLGIRSWELGNGQPKRQMTSVECQELSGVTRWVYLTGTVCHLSKGEELKAKSISAMVSPYLSCCYARGCKFCSKNDCFFDFHGKQDG